MPELWAGGSHILTQGVVIPVPAEETFKWFYWNLFRVLKLDQKPYTDICLSTRAVIASPHLSGQSGISKFTSIILDFESRDGLHWGTVLLISTWHPCRSTFSYCGSNRSFLWIAYCCCVHPTPPFKKMFVCAFWFSFGDFLILFLFILFLFILLFFFFKDGMELTCTWRGVTVDRTRLPL